MIRRWLRRVFCINYPSEVFASAWRDNFYHGWWDGIHRRRWPRRYVYHVRSRQRLTRTTEWCQESDQAFVRRLPEAATHLRGR